MKRGIKLILLITFILYLAASAYTVYLLFTAPEVKEVHNFVEEQDTEIGKEAPTRRIQPNKRINIQSRRRPENKTNLIEVWSKVGLGSYTWEHIFGGHLEPRLGGVWSYGELRLGSILFRIRDGDGVLPDKVPQDVDNLLLILNGRSQDRVQYTQAWLDYLGSYHHLSRVALMLIGNEQCQNDWVLPYMKSRGGKIDVLFIVYDTLIVNGMDILQWPLGAATYRGFPVIHSNQLSLVTPRRYRCNFLGTVYPNSSREQLLGVIRDEHLESYCFTKTRQIWEPDETDSSLQSYISILLQSDLTLSPVGMNAECYRIYEACALGSVPVVEDITTRGDCSRNPFRMLKELDAPFIFIRDWKELPKIIEQEISMSIEEIVERREKLVAWYERFKHQMRDILLGKIQGLFEGDKYR